MFVTLLVFLLILGILVFVHELGHFLVAKRAGVRVDEFAFGFKPRLWGKKIGDTTYAINAIPLGGYVRLYGEGENETGPQSFREKTIAQRLAIFVAGSAMNVLLAFLILIVLFTAGFNPLFPGVGSNPFVESQQSVAIAKINDNSPAAQAGLGEGQIIAKVNDTTITSDSQFISLINEHKGSPTTLTIQSEGIERIVEITPRANPPQGEGALGVVIALNGKAKTPFYKAPLAAGYEVGRIVWGSIVGFVGFVSKLVVDQQVSEDVTGIVGVGQLTAIYRRVGIDYLAQLVAVISIGLAVVNLVPMLPLDGGHAAALVYEKIARRPLSEKQFATFAAIGMAIVLLLFVTVTYKDFVRFDVIDRLINAF